jgi:hypothetical protein
MHELDKAWPPNVPIRQTLYHPMLYADLSATSARLTYQSASNGARHVALTKNGKKFR